MANYLKKGAMAANSSLFTFHSSLINRPELRMLQKKRKAGRLTNPRFMRMNWMGYTILWSHLTV